MLTRALLWLAIGLALTTYAGGAPVRVTATDVQQSTIYHSPQTPGYTCWVSAWQMPDGALRVSFHQATGPLTGRPMAPKAVQEALGWPPGGLSVGYDMSGTIQQLITLESRDAGRTWTQLSAEPYHTPMNGVYGGYAVLSDGTVLRTAWGMYLPFYDVPQTGYIQRSEDGGKTWSGPLMLMDDTEALTIPKRVRVLRDGRVMAIGGLIRLTEEVRTFRQGLAHIEAAFWLSQDGGRTWSEPVVPLTKADGAEPTEESDVAELPDGRLLLINRTNVPDRRQAVLRPVGDTFEVESRSAAPFPHSGMPDVLWAREGVALHIATSNISWTADAGATWGDLDLHTSYYPSSLQLPDGRLFCVGHRGSDDPYDGTVDQQVEALTFRLRVE